MKILSREQIRDVDSYTIKNEPIPSIELMERAATAFKKWFINVFDKSEKIAIVCGLGNNGGDGLAIARLLIKENYDVEVFAVKPKDKTSEDFQSNEDRLRKIKEINYITNDIGNTSFKNFSIIIDGIFGSGLSRPVDHGIFKEVIDKINESSATKVAIDIPSGLFSDQHTEGGSIVEADYTITFQIPKLAFFLPQNHQYVGNWSIVNIGLDEDYIQSLSSSNILIEDNHAAWIYNFRDKYSHKGDYGRGLLICGSFGKIGAAVLAARAALRSGIGLLTVHSPRCGYSILQSSVPEAMNSPDEDEKHFSMPPDSLFEYDAIGVGPGIGTDEITLGAYAKLLSEFKKPLVIDADGLNMIAKNHHLLDMVPEYSILTPHPKEFERLTGEATDDFDRLDKLRTYAKEHKLFVALKGRHTAVATPEGNIYFNKTGNPGMASGGTGDALTGIITSLLSQKYSSEEAVLLGVYLHGLAGDMASDMLGQDSLIASDLIDKIPEAFKKIIQEKNEIKRKNS